MGRDDGDGSATTARRGDHNLGHRASVGDSVRNPFEGGCGSDYAFRFFLLDVLLLVRRFRVSGTAATGE